MLLLGINVMHQLVQLAPANRKISVATLPEKRPVLLTLVFNPDRRGFLDVLQELSLADGPCQSRSDMYVIGRAADAVGLAIEIAADGG